MTARCLEVSCLTKLSDNTYEYKTNKNVIYIAPTTIRLMAHYRVTKNEKRAERKNKLLKIKLRTETFYITVIGPT